MKNNQTTCTNCTKESFLTAYIRFAQMASEVIWEGIQKMGQREDCKTEEVRDQICMHREAMKKIASDNMWIFNVIAKSREPEHEILTDENEDDQNALAVAKQIENEINEMESSDKASDINVQRKILKRLLILNGIFSAVWECGE